MATSTIKKQELFVGTMRNVEFWINESGNPIFRWVVNDNEIYQFNLTPTGITYYKKEGSSWETVWSNH